MIQRNPVFSRLSQNYLFPEITRRTEIFKKEHPDARVISLGIGNTTEPLTPHISAALESKSAALGTARGYSGYGDDFGLKELRVKIAEVIYNNIVDPDDVYISDGAKCDIARMQSLFGSNIPVVAQDPAYPVYIDGSVLVGAAGLAGQVDGGYRDIVYLPCTAENGFFPDVDLLPKNALAYFCSPNNPTGAVADKTQLAALVSAARKKGCVIIFDAAYSCFIRDPELPRSIFEIDGARECAIEINSFSKMIGFTGVRLGWSVVPRSLKYADGSLVRDDWRRIVTTLFNGASNIAQAGGLAALDTIGMQETRSLTDYYLENARIILEGLSGSNFSAAGAELYGGVNAPYIWARFPGQKSWDLFDKFLSQCQIITTAGAGFGPSGESFIRFSSFGHRDSIREAAARLSEFAL